MFVFVFLSLCCTKSMMAMTFRKAVKSQQKNTKPLGTEDLDSSAGHAVCPQTSAIISLSPFLSCEIKLIDPALPNQQDCCAAQMEHCIHADVRNFEILVYSEKRWIITEFGSYWRFQGVL